MNSGPSLPYFRRHHCSLPKVESNHQLNYNKAFLLIVLLYTIMIMETFCPY